ncbi:MAG: hypothetical protein JOY98_15775 [Candidatus Eremiobacteraeota bacterium]|nr:hypothetical protein [Candidatus Eremiobacteraeota bacterium]
MAKSNRLLRGRLLLSLMEYNQHGLYDHAMEAAGIFETADDSLRRAEALLYKGNALWRSGRLAEAATVGEEAVRIAGTLGLERFFAVTLQMAAVWVGAGADAARGFKMSEEALSILRALDDRGAVAHLLLNFAETKFAADDPQCALRFADEALELSRDNPVRSVNIQNNAAAYLIAMGRLDEAYERVTSAIAIASSLEQPFLVTNAVGHIAAISVLQGAHERAARLIGYVDGVYSQFKETREPTEARGYERTMQILRAALDAERLQTLLAEGARLSEGDAVREALLA